MKKLLLLPILALFLVSCSEDDAATIVQQATDTTTWKIHRITYNGVDTTFGACSSDDNMKLNVDGTGVIQGYYQNDDEECAASEPINFTYEINEGMFEIAYTLNGDQYQFSEIIHEYTGDTFTIDVSDRFAGPDVDTEVIATYKKI